jgi:predicted transcriptional regulator
MRQIESDVRLVRLAPDDVARRSDVYEQFRALVVSNEESYPAIAKWVDDKVASGIRSQQRVGFIAFLDHHPVASAVVKLGRESKFCHLRLSETVRDQNLGELFFSLMAAEVRHAASEVHFTLPASLWAEKESFFRGFGFTKAVSSGRQYRLFDDELRCTTPFQNVWNAVLQKLPKLAQRFAIHGHHMFSPLLLSITPRHAERIFSGDKSVEIRRRFSTKWAGAKSVIYASSPEKRLRGEVSIADVVPGPPDMIWNTFSSEIGCSHEEFESYAKGSDEVSALVLNDVMAYAQPIPLAQLEYLLQDQLMPPQSYCTTGNNAKWSAALAIAALLHGGGGANVLPRHRALTHPSQVQRQMSLL